MWFARLLALVALTASVLASWLAPAPARAHDFDGPSFAASCHATSAAEVDFEAIQQSTDWICNDEDWNANQPVAWLWFDSDSWKGEDVPRYFFSRITRFEAVHFAALDADGEMRELRHAEHDAEPFASGPVFQLELPEITDATSGLLVRIEKPHSVPLLTEARLSHYPEDADWSQVDMMLLALVIGMLILPLMFDISFFIVLRERFVAIHAVMVVTMMAYVLLAGGLIATVANVPVKVSAVGGPLAWAVGCGISALFLADFLEEGAQSRWMRRITIATGWWTMVVCGFFALQLHATQKFDDTGYFLAFIPTMMVMTVALAEAVWRGSVSARFVAVAWAPIILASLERMLRGLGVYSGPSTLDQLLYVATGLEVIVISLAIGDRFLSIRRERDAALTEAEMLEQLSERDPLTGLMNRRALESRFDDLREQGFDTLALADLDKFKDINDRFGHQVGDRTLVACADAIRGDTDRDSIAVRLGGEEFVVFLRGRNTLDRAEALRQAIALRIAKDIDGIDRLVTASMGVVEMPRTSKVPLSFDDLYKRADQLLYEAKAAGRNRMCFERLKVFTAAPPPREDASGSGRAAA